MIYENTKQILNIGTKHVRGTITANAIMHHVYEACFEQNVEVLGYTIRMSETEETVVVEIAPAMPLIAVEFLSNELWQDCIAVFNVDTRNGYLRGSKAAAWGDFDPSRFIMPDGRLLSDHRAKREQEK